MYNYFTITICAEQGGGMEIFMIEANIKNTYLKFETDKNVFSPGAIDKGTLAMLSLVEFSENDKVLDLGCGYGVVGLLAAKLIGEDNIIMADISDDAVRLAKLNAKLNGVNADIRKSCAYDNIPECDFTLILSNPPYNTNFSVAKEFIETGFKKLSVGGRLYMVTKRKEWYKNKLISVFGGVRIFEINGYNVFISEKRQDVPPKKHKKTVNKLSKKLRRKYSA